MLSISKIDGDLNIYKNSKVIIWGASADGKRMFDLLQFFEVEIFAFCDNDSSKWGSEFLEKNVVSPEMLKLKEWGENVLVQIGCTGLCEEETKKQLESMGIKNYVTSVEAERRLGQLRLKNICDELDENEKLKMYRKNEEILWHGYYANIFRYVGLEKCILLLPAKTGNGTLHTSLGAAGVSYCDLGHQIHLFNDIMTLKKGKKVKMISAVREPISQNLSYLYQMLTGRRNLYSGIDEAWKGGGDMQLLFDLVLDAEGYSSGNTNDGNQESKDFIQKASVFNDGLIQNFMPSFCSNVLDVMKYPFDKKKGYTIIVNENVEIFLYQLEKMNEVWSPLVEWIGDSEINLVKSNVAEEKWCKESYNQAAQKIVFSKQYFNKCYNELYVKHFYSEEDIELFKSKWTGRVL